VSAPSQPTQGGVFLVKIETGCPGDDGSFFSLVPSLEASFFEARTLEAWVQLRLYEVVATQG
jgi:hypothetical protein